MFWDTLRQSAIAARTFFVRMCPSVFMYSIERERSEGNNPMIIYGSIASEKNYVTSSVIFLFDWPCIHSRPRVGLDYLKRSPK